MHGVDCPVVDVSCQQTAIGRSRTSDEWALHLGSPRGREMTEFFSREQIDEIRECFNVYSQDGIVHSAPQLRCILRSLGYSPTAAKTVEYFRKNKQPMNFAAFLEIAKEEHNSGDELTEIIKALKGLDRSGTRSIPAQELRSILASIGERMSLQEIDLVLKQVAVGGIVPHQKLIEYISK